MLQQWSTAGGLGGGVDLLISAKSIQSSLERGGDEKTDILSKLRILARLCFNYKLFIKVGEAVGGGQGARKHTYHLVSQHIIYLMFLGSVRLRFTQTWPLRLKENPASFRGNMQGYLRTQIFQFS